MMINVLPQRKEDDLNFTETTEKWEQIIHYKTVVA